MNLFHTSTLDWHLEDGTGIRIAQQTEYPWKGAVDFTVDPAHAAGIQPVPAHSGVVGRKPRVTAGRRGRFGNRPKAGEYFEIHRRWEPGDRVHVEFDMKPRLMRANPLVREDAGRVAVERGPLVYCLEQPDQPGFNLFDASLLADGASFSERVPGRSAGRRAGAQTSGYGGGPPLSGEPLYRALPEQAERSGKRGRADLHSLLCVGQSRGARMEVWVPYTDSRCRVTA